MGPPTSPLAVIVNPAPFSRIPPPTLPEMVTCFPKTRRSRPRLPSRFKYSTKTVRLPPIFPADSKFTRSSNVRTFFATLPRIVSVFVNARIFPSTCPSTCSVCANPNTSPWTCPFTVASCPNKNTSPCTVPSTFTRSPNRKISPLIVSSELTPTDGPLRVSEAVAAVGSASTAQNPAKTSATAEPRLFQLLLPRLDIARIKCVNACRCQSKHQAPDPLHRPPCSFLELRQPRRQRLVFFQHRPR